MGSVSEKSLVEQGFLSIELATLGEAATISDDPQSTMINWSLGLSVCNPKTWVVDMQLDEAHKYTTSPQ